jgi:hypothetical protein
MYNVVHSSAPVSEDDFKDCPQRDSLETVPLAGTSLQDGKPNTGIRRLSLKLGLLVAVVAAIIGLAIFIVINSRDHHMRDKTDYIIETHVSSTSKTNNKPHPCGNSSAQARELGCSFNQLTWTWLPPNCPSYANDLFMSTEERPWVYWEDLGQTRVVEGDVWEQVLNGELRIFGERREHVTHCIFLLLTYAQIIRDGTPYFEKLAQYEHAKHCTDILLEIVRKEPGWNDVQTFAGTVSFDQYCEESNVVTRPRSSLV